METIKKEKVELGDGKDVVIYDSGREVTMDELREHCELNEIEVPEEGSSEYWDWVATFQEWDWQDFVENLKCSRRRPEKVVITGTLGLWDGRHEIVPVLTDMDDPEKFLGLFTRNCGCDYRVRVGYDEDGLYVSTSHHDGTNCLHIREVTPDGLEYIRRCDEEGEEPDILSDGRYTAKIDYWLY